MKPIHQIRLLLISMLLPTGLFASITIDSVSTTASTCVNNGVATIYAHSSGGGVLLYAITAGPSLAGIQNSNVFSSLYPGMYTARVYDSSFDSLDVQFQIGGNYQLPDFTLSGLDPTCPGFTDGAITALVDTTKGLAPYVYEIISPVVVPQQSSPFFPNLTANNYFVRVTDACGNYQTRTETLFNTGTAIDNNTFIIPSVIKIGCDTVVVSINVQLLKEKWTKPLTVTYTTLSNTITKQASLLVIDTIFSVPGYFQITDTLVGLTYGDYLNVSLTDICGVSVSSALNTISPFEFDVFFTPTTVNCSTTFTASAALKQFPNHPYDYTTPKSPLSFVLTDAFSGQVVDSGTCYSTQCGIYLIAQTPGNLYTLSVTDGCGEFWQSQIVWPTASGTPTVTYYNSTGCIDSTAAITFVCENFLSPVRLTILSGPPIAESTKPHYNYRDTLIYPQSFFGAISPGLIYLKDFPIGTYTYEAEDSCGNIVSGTFIVEPYMVANLGFFTEVRPSCLNNNTIFFNFQLGTGGAVAGSITNLANGQSFAIPAANYQLDSLTNFNIGSYAFEVYYGKSPAGGTFYDGGLINNGNACWVLRDTLTILPYANNSFLTNSTVYCNGTYFLSLEVDSTRGVPPYRFAIIGGPQIFPLQDSSFFQISAFGNYVISMEDACGNNYTQQISVTSDSFPPIVKKGFFCEGNFSSLSMASSPYFSHSWMTPAGNIITSDSLLFQPFTAADTGFYTVTSTVTINGCSDTYVNTFYLSGKDSVVQSLLICPGDSVYVGSSLYLLPGQYRDTLSTSSGCDSLVITNISYQPLTVDSSSLSICAGDSILIGSLYVFQPGVYTDTVAISGNCRQIRITSLSVNAALFDSTSAVICEGDTFMLGNIAYTQAGIYTDTLISAGGCDSVMVVSLSFTPLQIDTVNATLCNGDSVQVGSNYYSAPGTYIDTLSLGGNCRQIQITQLDISFSTDSITAVICEGDTFRVGNSVYMLPGTYIDTLTALNGCDSVVVSQISFSSVLIDTVYAAICYGDSVVAGSSVYFQAGTYTDTLSISGNCKKIQITEVSINQITDSINAVLCAGDTFWLAGNYYLSTGIYTDTLSAASGCDSVLVSTLTFIEGGTAYLNQTLCEGDSFFFAGIYLDQEGVYYDTLSSAACDSVVILQLNVSAVLPLNPVSDSTVIQQGSTVQLSSNLYSGWTYQWQGAAAFGSPSSFATTATPDSSSWIYLSAVNPEGCSQYDSLWITVNKDDGADSCRYASLFIPNAFTPNNDGVNDRYRILSDFLDIRSLKIFNRWGELVFESSASLKEWDGNFKGSKCPSGTYVCLVSYQNCKTGKAEAKKGFITLME